MVTVVDYLYKAERRKDEIVQAEQHRLPPFAIRESISASAGSPW